MIQQFNKDFAFAYNKTKNLAFYMDSEAKLEYVTNRRTDKYELVEQYADRKTTYILNHIMNISGTPVFYIDGEIEVSTYEPTVTC